LKNKIIDLYFVTNRDWIKFEHRSRRTSCITSRGRG